MAPCPVLVAAAFCFALTESLWVSVLPQRPFNKIRSRVMHELQPHSPTQPHTMASISTTSVPVNLPS